MDEQLMHRVVGLAVQAPSVYNTQPWRFVATGAGLDLYADRTRQLTVLDPTGRQLTISCGAALGLARLAVAALGYSHGVELLPDSDDPDHLARLVVGDPAPVAGDDLALAREIGRRHTVRDRFDTVRVTRAARAALDREADANGASLRWLDSAQPRVVLAVLTDRADRIEQADPAIRTELARWQRRDDAATDGIPPGALPRLPLGLRASDVPLRDLGPAPADPSNADPQQLPLPAERPDLAVLCTRFDGPTSWLQAGQALARVLLRATELDLAVSPVGQALDLAWTRRRLRLELGLAGHPQLVLRLGHALPTGRGSPRRPVAEVLEAER